MTEQSTDSTPVLRILRAIEQRGIQFVRSVDPDVHIRALQFVTAGVRSNLAKIYGPNSEYLAEFPLVSETSPQAAVRETFLRRMDQLRRIIEGLETLVSHSAAPARGKRIFIGHGHSPLWRELKDFVSDRLDFPWDEFNREAVAGYTTSERLENMLSEAMFAFLVMTAEEENRDGGLHARPNVIHEVGLFQGRLGLRRAIVLLEDGCSGFSNISGLSEIRFPRGDISARFEEVRRVLEREIGARSSN